MALDADVIACREGFVVFIAISQIFTRLGECRTFPRLPEPRIYSATRSDIPRYGC